MSATFAHDLRELDAAEINAVSGGGAALLILAGVGLLGILAYAATAASGSQRSGSSSGGSTSPKHPADDVRE